MGTGVGVGGHEDYCRDPPTPIPLLEHQIPEGWTESLRVLLPVVHINPICSAKHQLYFFDLTHCRLDAALALEQFLLNRNRMSGSILRQILGTFAEWGYSPPLRRWNMALGIQ